MKVLILMVALLLAGCGGLDGQSVHYLRQSQPFQTKLQSYQTKLKEVSAVPLEQRGAAAKALLAEVEADHKKLGELTPSAKVMPVHKELDTLYTTLEDFIKATLSGRGDAKDPRVGQLSKQWADHLDKLQVELQHLGP
ncbi:MAG: hypothetical protein KF760_14125 [Candidatus Eremiobacteraeota bacterium]|nr:hypothetical protein [Candidatus Eremiobacteraeota bacterium]MCW5868948.1 hypothetical protein [Candidatus Eremiobacteraeota bacterium]